MANFTVKFFGSKDNREQLKQVKMGVESQDKASVERTLKLKHGYVHINGLKIREL